jgi:hypothetical protein
VISMKKPITLFVSVTAWVILSGCSGCLNDHPVKGVWHEETSGLEVMIGSATISAEGPGVSFSDKIKLIEDDNDKGNWYICATDGVLSECEQVRIISKNKIIAFDMVLVR